jgi:hypothetical protein
MQHVDSNREIRAMILCALPYPPLPVAVRRFEDGNKLGDEVVCSSHDLISQLLEVACVRGRGDDNAERQERQRGILREFLADLVKDGPLDPPRLFEVYCQRTHEHIATYCPNGRGLPEVRFMPFGYVCKGDKHHAKVCEYMAAQAILLELQGGKATQDWMGVEFCDLLSVARDRLVCEAADKRARGD